MFKITFFQENSEYLFGIFYVEDGKEIFKPFWSHNKYEEKESVVQFFNLQKLILKNIPNQKFNTSAPHEINALERLTLLHKVHSVDYDHYLNLGRFVDLFRVVKQAIYVSQKSYSIKDIEKYYDFKRSGDILKGDVSEEFYIQWMQNKNQQLLDKIEEYTVNKIASQHLIRKWLLKIKPEGTKWFVPEKEQMELRPFEEILLEYQEKFTKSKVKIQKSESYFQILWAFILVNKNLNGDNISIGKIYLMMN